MFRPYYLGTYVGMYNVRYRHRMSMRGDVCTVPSCTLGSEELTNGSGTPTGWMTRIVRLDHGPSPLILDPHPVYCAESFHSSISLTGHKHPFPPYLIYMYCTHVHQTRRRGERKGRTVEPMRAGRIGREPESYPPPYLGMRCKPSVAPPLDLSTAKYPCAACLPTYLQTCTYVSNKYLCR